MGHPLETFSEFVEKFKEKIPNYNKKCFFDELGHYPRSVQTRQLCRHCRQKAKYICFKCEVGVYPKCF